jgi:hypothetical protein
MLRCSHSILGLIPILHGSFEQQRQTLLPVPCDFPRKHSL